MFTQTVIFSIVFLESKWELKPFNSLILNIGEIFTAMPGFTVSFPAKDKWIK